MTSVRILQTIVWSALTIGSYMVGKTLHRRHPSWWTSPLVVAPLLLISAVLAFHVSYQEYSRSTHWLVALLAPASVAFAIPIYEQRSLIRRYWPLLVGGLFVGSATAMYSCWVLSGLFGLDSELRLSLLPRSLSTPFAVIVSGKIGGVPGLTALFVLITGILGATIGEIVLKYLPLQSMVARGMLFGMGAHAVGTVKAHQLDREVGAVSGLVMVLVGVLNVLATPVLGLIFR